MENPQPQNGVSKWVRLLYMVMFAILYKVAEFVMWVVVLFQVIVTLMTGGPNERALRFGKQLSVYVYCLWAYRAYFIVRTPATSGRPEVANFVGWLVAEAAAMAVKDGDGRKSGRKHRSGN